MPEDSSGIGAVFGAFSSDYKPNVTWQTIDNKRQKRIGSLWGQYDASADPLGNKDYLSAYASNTPAARKISEGNLGFLNKTVTGNYDPTEAYGQLLGMNQSALGNFMMNPAMNELTRQRKASQARGGYGGQGQGTYDALLQGRTLQQLASQAVPNLLGYTNQAYGTAGNLRQQDIMNRLGIIGSGEQYRQLDTPALRYLEPTRLARSDLQANLGALGSLADQEDENRAYYRRPDGAERWSKGLNRIQTGTVNELNDAMDLYQRYASMGMGGGAGGGMGGMMGGGGGAGGAAAGGAAGASGGFDMAQAMKIAQQANQAYGDYNRNKGVGYSPYSDQSMQNYYPTVI